MSISVTTPLRCYSLVESTLTPFFDLQSLQIYDIYTNCPTLLVILQGVEDFSETVPQQK